jgi:hypothetical protein
MKLLPILTVAAPLAVAASAAAADPVVDAFYNRCVAENSYRMQPAELESACACMAPVMVSFLTIDARRQIEAAIQANKPATLSSSPFKGDPATLARRAIRECPAVGEAMYRQNCSGANATKPQCQEMKAMIDQAE